MAWWQNELAVRVAPMHGILSKRLYPWLKRDNARQPLCGSSALCPRNGKCASSQSFRRRLVRYADYLSAANLSISAGAVALDSSAGAALDVIRVGILSGKSRLGAILNNNPSHCAGAAEHSFGRVFALCRRGPEPRGFAGRASSDARLVPAALVEEG